MSLLIDTHVFLWFESGSAKLAHRLRKTIARSDERVFISAASFWEIAIERRTGKLALEGSPRAAAARGRLPRTADRGRDTETAGALDWEHRDPSIACWSPIASTAP